MNFMILLTILGYLTMCISIKIKTKLGEIQGAPHTSRDGKTYYAFTRVPFAKPPVGKLRIKNPVEAGPWEGVLDATVLSPSCFQTFTMIPRKKTFSLGQEDCLYLSIYTPDLTPKENLAVILQIHGGAFAIGSGGPKDNADFLVDGGVILVNIHYRLGPFGFISMEDNVIPGNYGLKDQAMAIRWVHENIDDYGGDPGRITLIGQSAGAASCQHHMRNPSLNVLLKGVILQSGAISKRWSLSLPGIIRERTKDVAGVVGCGGKDGEELLECFQNVDAKTLSGAENHVKFWDTEPVVYFAPTREPPGDGAFLTYDPFQMESHLPLIAGVVDDEGLVREIGLRSQPVSVIEDLIANLEKYILRIGLLQDRPDAKDVFMLLKSKYFSEPITIKSAQRGYGQFFADLFIHYPIEMSARSNKGPVYQYKFDYVTGSSIVTTFGKYKTNVTCHGDELLTLYNYKTFFRKRNPDEEQVSRMLVRLLTNFAKFQKPTLDEDEIQWPLYEPTKRQYLRINTKLSVGQDLLTNITEWWAKILDGQ